MLLASGGDLKLATYGPTLIAETKHRPLDIATSLAETDTVEPCIARFIYC